MTRARMSRGAWVALGVLAFLLLAAPARRAPRVVIDVFDEAGNLEGSSDLDRL